MRKLLWVGDACCATGFATVTHNILEHLRADWEVSVLGINYNGLPHNYPYKIYRARSDSRHCAWGGDVVSLVASEVKPDVVLVNNDLWNLHKITARLDDMMGAALPVVGYCPVDAPNIKREIVDSLTLAHLVVYTDFARRELAQAGYQRPVSVVPHGVESAYRPLDRAASREEIGKTLGVERLPEDCFIVGNVNRNQPRKRLDLTLMYFADWVKYMKIPEDVFLLLRCRPFEPTGWDLIQLAEYLGVKDRLIILGTLKQELLPAVYSSLDVQVTTTLGEGWGLTQHEGMACGVPQIVPDWAALGEWPGDAVIKVPIGSRQATPEINTIGGVAHAGDFITALNRLYRYPDLRLDYGRRARERALSPRFEWKNIASRLSGVLAAVLDGDRKELAYANA